MWWSDAIVAFITDIIEEMTPGRDLRMLVTPGGVWVFFSPPGHDIEYLATHDPDLAHAAAGYADWLERFNERIAGA